MSFSLLLFGPAARAPALCLSHLDPSNQIQTDAVNDATLGVNLYVPSVPARLSIDFTHRLEQAGRELD